MDITNPVLTPFPYPTTPLGSGTPLTFREGATLLSIIERLKSWIMDSVGPELHSAVELAVTEFSKGLVNAENTIIANKKEWQNLFDAFIANVVVELKKLNDSAIAELMEDESSETNIATSILINEQVEQLNVALNVLITNLQDTKVNTSEVGSANGLATLDAAGKVPAGQLTATTLSGNYNARPLPSAVPVGTTYHSIDTVESYMSKGNVWVRVGRGGYLGSASLVSLFETSSVDLVDVTGLAVTFIAGAGATKFTVTGDAINTVNDGLVVLVLEVNGVDSGHINIQLPDPNKSVSFTRVFERTNLIPGNSYNAKIKMLVSYITGGFGKLDGQPYNPVSLIVEGM